MRATVRAGSLRSFSLVPRRGIGADPNEQSSLELRELVRSLVQQIQIGEAQSLAEALHTYIAAAGIGEDRKGWLFRTSRGHDATVLSEQPINQSDAWRMIRRRAVAAGIYADRQSHVPRDRHHRLSCQWRRARTRAGDGGAREPAHHKTL